MQTKRFEQITERILSVTKPKQIILFGSQARGTAMAESDYDILVVEDVVKDKLDETFRIRKALRPLRISKDVIVVSTKHFEEFKQIPSTLMQTISEEGITLYEQK
jgi:predicted nucleotidyltransferase